MCFLAVYVFTGEVSIQIFCPFFKNKIIYLFIFGCVGSSLLHAGFLQLQRAEATLRCGARASHCGGFSCCGAWALECMGFSSCGLQGLECRLSSCGTRAQLLHSMWDLPGPGLEPMSPALAGRFLTTVPPGKSAHFLIGSFGFFFFFFLILSYISCLYVLEINSLSVSQFVNIFSSLQVVFSFCLWFPLLCKGF